MAQQSYDHLIPRITDLLQADFTMRQVSRRTGVPRSTLQQIARWIKHDLSSRRRDAGGNSPSINKGWLTDLYLSNETMQHMRDWTTEEMPGPPG